MSKIKITLSDVAKKHLRILAYLLVSGVLGWFIAVYLAGRPELVAVFAPAINYLLYAIKTELDKEGYIKALKDR